MKLSNSETCNKKPLISLLVSRYHYQILEVGTVHQELDPQQRTTWHELESRRKAWGNFSPRPPERANPSGTLM